MDQEIKVVAELIAPFMGCDKTECVDKRPGGKWHCATFARTIVKATERVRHDQMGAVTAGDSPAVIT